jgi:hypothetical protein
LLSRKYKAEQEIKAKQAAAGVSNEEKKWNMVL